MAIPSVLGFATFGCLDLIRSIWGECSQWSDSAAVGTSRTAGESGQADLPIDLMAHIEPLDGQDHPCLEPLVALQPAAAHRLLDGVLDLPLRGHADHLEELAEIHVELVL